MKQLTPEDFKIAAEVLGCESAVIQAVAEVESSGLGFLKDGRPVVKYEGHIFHKLTKGKYSKLYPTLSYPKWTEKHTQSKPGEWDRLAKAIELDRDKALQSASWGKFQIMGFNFRLCGYKTVQEFVTAQYKGEGEQLNAFVNFIIARGLKKDLQEKNWKAIALKYNGTEYYKNRYDVKMAAAYVKYREKPI